MEHRWNSRRCIKFRRYTAEREALSALRFINRWYPPQMRAVQCPWCGAWHLVRPFYYTAGYTGAQFIADLPPLHETFHADPSRYYPNQRRA